MFSSLSTLIAAALLHPVFSTASRKHSGHTSCWCVTTGSVILNYFDAALHDLRVWIYSF